MSEPGGGEFSEEEIKTSENRSQPQPEYNRRQILGGLLGGLFAAKQGVDALRKPGESASGREEKNSPPVTEVAPNPQSLDESPQVKVVDHVESQQSEGISPEQQKLIEDTANHLVTLYGKTMDSRYYPDNASKKEFWVEVTKMGLRLNAENPNLGNQLAAVMALESAGTFAPDKKNVNNSGATGLIQFIEPTAESLGTTTEKLSHMSPQEQLTFVEKYFSSFSYQFASVDDVYMAVFAPHGLNKGPDELLYEPGSVSSNRNLVLDRLGGNNDGKITKREATQSVINIALQYGEKIGYLEDYRKQPLQPAA